MAGEVQEGRVSEKPGSRGSQASVLHVMQNCWEVGSPWALQSSYHGDRWRESEASLSSPRHWWEHVPWRSPFRKHAPMGRKCTTHGTLCSSWDYRCYFLHTGLSETYAQRIQVLAKYATIYSHHETQEHTSSLLLNIAMLLCEKIYKPMNKTLLYLCSMITMILNAYHRSAWYDPKHFVENVSFSIFGRRGGVYVLIFSKSKVKADHLKVICVESGAAWNATPNLCSFKSMDSVPFSFRLQTRTMNTTYVHTHTHTPFRSVYTKTLCLLIVIEWSDLLLF